jgi:hypothetical protein
MKGRSMLVVAVALLGIAAGAGSAYGSASLYVASGPGYSAAFKARAGRVYVMALDARAYCRGTGSHSDEHSKGSFNVFPTPVRMRHTKEGLRGADHLDAGLWSESGVVRGRFHRGAITGTLAAFFNDEETECRTGSYDGDPQIPFKAVRYVPLGSARAGRSSAGRGRGRVYFTNSGSVEVYLRRVGGKLIGLRGAARQVCPIPASASHPPRVPLFFYPENALLGGDGNFKRHDHFHGARRHRFKYDERMWMTGRFEPGAVVGRYHRVKTRKRGDRVLRRCETGPVSYRAIRYVPAR